MLHRLIKKKRISEGGRVFKELQGRKITILCHNGTVYCFDTLCSHMGGPLGEKGEVLDIEDSAGQLHSCIVCPAHSRKFDLKTGEQVTTDLAGEMCKSAQEQRVHAVLDGQDDYWWVLLCENQREIASDKYNLVLLPEEVRSGWEEERKPWPLAAAPEDISSSQESSFSSAPLQPYSGGERFAVVMSPVRKKSRPMADQVQPATRHLGFEQTTIPFRSAKSQAIIPQHKATAWSNRREKVQRTIGNYFPPTSLAVQTAMPQPAATAAPSSLFFSTAQAPSPVGTEHFDDMDTS